MDYRQWTQHFAQATDRWELMRQIQREWGVPCEDAQSYSAEEIAESEVELGFALPRALAEWYTLSSNPFFLKPRLFWTHLYSPPELTLWPEGARTSESLIVFQAEYQYCWEWAFRTRDAHLADPPVWIGSTQGECPPEDWRLQNDTLTEYFLQLLLVRLVHFGPRYSGIMKSLTPDLTARLEHHFPDMGFPVWHEYGPECKLRGGQDVLLLTHAKPPFASEDPELILAASSHEGLKQATELLNVEWDCVEKVGATRKRGKKPGWKPKRGITRILKRN